MKKHFCRTFSLLLAAVTLLTVLSAGISVSAAAADGQVNIGTTSITYSDGTTHTSTPATTTLVDGKVPASIVPSIEKVTLGGEETEGWILAGWTTQPITYDFWWEKSAALGKFDPFKHPAIPEGWNPTRVSQKSENADAPVVDSPDEGSPDAMNEVTQYAVDYFTWLWKWTNEKGTFYNLGDTITGPVETLYPYFRPTTIEYALHYNGFNGTGGVMSCTRQFASPFGLATHTGSSGQHQFIGWFTTAKSGENSKKLEDTTVMKGGKPTNTLRVSSAQIETHYYIHWKDTTNPSITQDDYEEGSNREVYGGFEHTHTFDYSNYNCTQPLKCTTCDYQLPAAYTTHKMDTAWTWGSETHCHRCLNPNCKHVEGAANHTWVYANGKEAACADKRCSVCNYRVSGSSVHRNVPSTYYTDSTYHWQICNDCGLKVNRIAHKWVQKSDDNAHWDECSVCGKTKNKTAHTLTQKTDGQYHWQVCTVCGKEVSKTAHYASSYQHDGSSHWQVCASCGTVFGKTAHVPGAPVVTTTNNGSTTTTQTVITCTVCGYQISSTTATLENEKPKPAATATPAPAATAKPAAPAATPKPATPAATPKPAATATPAPAATAKPAATATPAPAATSKPATSTATVSVSQFKDVKATAYYAAPVAWAVENGITSGTSATTFGPDVSCTRGQAVTFLWNAAGKPEPTSTANPFTDVKPTDYYYKAVLWAKEKGVTSGTSATTFGPNVACTRAQIVTFLWNANGKPAPQSTSSSFTDVRASDYYSKAVLWAKENGVTSGTSATTFGSNASCNRGQIVTFLYNDAN